MAWVAGELPPPRLLPSGAGPACPGGVDGFGGVGSAGLTAAPPALCRRMLVVEVANGRSLVWGAEAVQALRERLGVGGRTVGALPRGPRQNSRLGLPLLLLPEEARLLAEIGAVTLVSAPRPDPRSHGLVSEEPQAPALRGGGLGGQDSWVPTGCSLVSCLWGPR